MQLSLILDREFCLPILTNLLLVCNDQTKNNAKGEHSSASNR